jgi:LysM repeat protein
LGALPAETKQSLQEITIRSEERMKAFLEAQRQEGKNPDPIELAKMRQQTRDELTRVLSPPQLEEFLLRYSDEANQLRSELGQLQYFNASSNDFRLIFRARDQIDQQLQFLVGDDPNTVAQRKALEDQRDNAMKVALGPRRYQEYQMLHDPLYRDAVAKAEEAGTPEAALTIYQVNLAAMATQDAIRSNATLTASQKAIEQKQLEADQLRANALATGQELPPEPVTPPPRRTYTLRPGDTPGVVAMIYGVPETAIRAANPNVDFTRLRPGDAINIPRSALTPKGAPRIGLGGP